MIQKRAAGTEAMEKVMVKKKKKMENKKDLETSEDQEVGMVKTKKKMETKKDLETSKDQEVGMKMKKKRETKKDLETSEDQEEDVKMEKKMETEKDLETSEDKEVGMEDLKRLYKGSVFGAGLLVQKKLESSEDKDKGEEGEEGKLTRKAKKALRKEKMVNERKNLSKSKRRNLKKSLQRKRKQMEKKAKMREEEEEEEEEDEEEEEEEEENEEKEKEEEEENEEEEEEEHKEEEAITLEGDLLKTYRHRKALRDSRCLCITLDSSRAKVSFPDAVSVRFKMIGMVRMCFVEYRSAMEADLKKYEIKRMEGINSVQFAGADKAENKPIIVNPYQLFVEGLPLDPQREDLENLFPTASKILRRKRESFANIVYKDKAEAEKVFRESGVVTMRGSKLTVLYSSKKKSQVTKKNSVRHDLYKRKVEEYKRKMTRKLRKSNTE
ncbi:cilia- and flagella-associated protein 251-like isoform X2 [Penaeus chinensis]|uniref:cilia- and flagella-associated protein 251-like isoform X2 n=1 Tax=Penaeus chinensis TaxID=139456 RepID=UPI001FB73375|nr:cilia- and flagella-associated protein 251-like isoform X2 [Penaeus chinensis]